MSKFFIKEEQIVEQAKSIVGSRLCDSKGSAILSLKDAKNLAAFKLSVHKHEVFAGIILDSQLRVIKYIEFFNGTIDCCSVYPREVVRKCIEYNASAVVFMHNHPSGVVEPSEADKRITQVLVDALSLIDVKVNDHLIFAGNRCYSFAERHILPISRLN